MRIGSSLNIDNDDDWLMALHPVTPTEMQVESLRVARVIDRAGVVKFRVCTERKNNLAASRTLLMDVI